MSPDGRSFASRWSCVVGNGMFMSQVPGLCLISNITLLLPPSDSLVRFEGRKDFVQLRRSHFNMAISFINTIPANSLDLSYYKYQKLISTFSY